MKSLAVIIMKNNMQKKGWEFPIYFKKQRR